MATQQAARTDPGAPSDAPATGSGKQPRAEAPATSGAGRVTALRLPLVTLTFTRRPHPEPEPDRQLPIPVPPDAGQRVSGSAPAIAGVPLPRLAFYTCAVALGALEVVEWPVTLLVIAGAYLADHVRAPGAAGSIVPDRAVPETLTDRLAASGLVPPSAHATPGGT